LRQRFGRELSPKEVLVGYAGRLVTQKGFQVFVAAARRCQIAAAHPRPRFVIIGGAPRDASSDPLAWARAVMPPGTLFTGHVEDPEEYIADLDVLVVPSLMRDPFPRVVIEAMALGVPVVASSRGGIPEAIRDGTDGVLVHAADINGLASRIQELAQSEMLRKKMSLAARSRALREYSSELTAKRVQELLLHGRVTPFGRAQSASVSSRDPSVY
jgi:glycosyltransferase involved in cell wall biosynthesis